MSNGFLTRIDLFRARAAGGWSTHFEVSRWRRERAGRVTNLVLVTPGESARRRQGGFVEALEAARRLARPGETVRVRVYRRDRRQQWRVVNSYPVQLPRDRKRVVS